MANCIVCNAFIARGKRYHSERYKSLPFCSKVCYDQYIAFKDKPIPNSKSGDFKKLTNYINTIWEGDINWAWLGKQIKSMCKEYELTHYELYLVLKYAYVYEEYKPDSNYGLGQFVKFIEPAKQFAKEIRKNQDNTKDIQDDTVIIKKNNRNNKRKWRER